MKRWLLAVALAVVPLMAQNPNEEIQKLVPLKYAEPIVVQNLLRDFGVAVRIDQRTKVIALSGQRNRVTTAEDAIKQLDVPSAAQKDIDLMVYFVVGSDVAAPAAGAVPQDLQSTIATLKTTFPFKIYYLLDALSLRTRSGVGASTTGQLSGARLTTFSVGSANVEGDGSQPGRPLDCAVPRADRESGELEG